MQLVSRDAWGARPPRNRTPLHRDEQRGTGVHYSGSAAESKSDHGLCDNVVRSIQNFHMDSRGWSDIAYSYLVCWHGFVFEGRGRGIRTAANGTTAGNDAYHAVCFLGGDAVARDDVTDAGRLAIRQAVEHCNAWAGVDEVQPHSFFKSTECPGDELRAWIAAGMPVAPPVPPEEDDMTPEQAEMLKRIHDNLFNGHTRQNVPIDNLYRDANDVREAMIVPGTTTASQAFELLFARVRDIHQELFPPEPPPAPEPPPTP